MTAARTAYQETIAAAIVAAGHTVEWKPIAEICDRRDHLHIDGVPCGSDLDGARPEVASVRGVDGNSWRARKLPADPRKAAAVLLDRLESVTYEAAQMKASAARSRARHAAEQQIVAAIGDLPGLHVEAHPLRVFVSFTANDLTPEKAARLGEAIRAALAPPTRDDELYIQERTKGQTT